MQTKFKGSEYTMLFEVSKAAINPPNAHAPLSVKYSPLKLSIQTIFLQFIVRSPLKSVTALYRNNAEGSK